MKRRTHMEKPLIKKMKEDYGYFGMLSILYGLIVAFCFYKNSHGITIIFYVGITILFALLYMKRVNFKLQKKSKRYFAGMILLSVATCLTTDVFFITFNFIGILLLFGVAMIRQFYDDGKWNFPAYLERIFILFGTTILRLPYPFKHGIYFATNKKQGKGKTFAAVFTGLLISLGLVSVILPPLLNSDLMFAKIFGEILKYINFRNLFGITMFVLIGFVSFYAFYTALGSYNFPLDNNRKIKYYNPVIGITFTSVLAIVYSAYCVIQILYLFLGVSKGLPKGVSYSEYARSGFWELLFVAVVNFILVLVCMYVYSKSNILRGVLTFISICTYIMIISAAYRITIYVSQYHLSFLRVLAMWFLLVLSLIMVGVIVNIYKEAFPLSRYIITIISVCYILFALGRPNYWIVQYNVAHTQNMGMKDLNYLIKNFPEDAAGAIAKLNPEEIAEAESSYYDDSENNKVERVKGHLYDYYAQLKQDNQGIYFRQANYARIRARQIAEEYLEEHAEDEKYAFSSGKK